MIDGILIVDKPAGITSHDVVARARRILQTKRIGHTGTLDPFATGVIVLLVGQATRLAQFLDKDFKEYEAVVRLGFETDTGDKTGSPKSQVQSSKSFSVDEIENVLEDFRGEIWQTPPMFSAKKIAGVKLYELARKGIEIERKAVKVNIYKLETAGELQIANDELRKETNAPQAETSADFGLQTSDFGLKVSCSAGTYIRTLAEDIGKKLETGAHLAALRRTGAGKFRIENSVALDELERIVRAEKLGEILISTNDAVAHLPQIELSDKEAAKVKNGMRLKSDEAKITDKNFVRLTKDENLIAVGVYDAGEKTVQPTVVLV